MEALEKKGVIVTFTSGTSGKFSFLPRGELTWMRQRYSIACGTMEIFGKNFDPDRAFMQFAPNPVKTFIAIGRLTSALHMAMFTRQNLFYIVDHKLTPDSVRISKGMTHGIKEKMMAKMGKYVQKKLVLKFVKNLELLAAAKRKMILGGTPSLIETVISILERKGTHLRLNDDVIIVTGGGWKNPLGALMSEEQFRSRIQSAWGIPDKNCRDIYAMSECSAIFPACEGHYKHVPHSIIYPLVLGDDLKHLGYGQYGRFAFLDPLTESYPGFIMTGDRVRMLESCPVCDRLGPVIESDVTRIKGVEERGCSAIMGELIAGQMSDVIKGKSS
jgi:phenylacetate-coenzyme A ligase PaaK-like adenylate-forming protein